jgi:phosphate starvation-inducible PhoH-like protein
LGSLPGNLEEKLDPYIFPSYYLLNKIIGKEAREELKKAEIIEVFALAYMRGRTFKKAFIVADEMQNATPNQMKMLLTRLGEGSEMVVTGDLNQADRLKDNGLIDFISHLESRGPNKHLDIVRFEQGDIERHAAVKEVLQVYGDE